MIDYLDLKRVTAMHRDEIQAAVARVVDSGWYLRGEATARFEAHYAAYIGTRHCVGCANGLDALTLIFRAYKQMGIMHDGDEVIVPANTYIASILAITENGLKPVLVEPWVSTLQINETRIEEAITSRTRAILLVHLYGRNAWTPGIQELCDRYRLKLVEDNAQAQGCTNSKFKIQNSQWDGAEDCARDEGNANATTHNSSLAGAEDNVQSSANKAAVQNGGHNYELCIMNYELKHTGSLGHAAAHSFYPGKNLGALGDAGAVTTDDAELAAMVRALGNYGSSEKYVFPYQGRNSRIDEVQAAVLDVKLQYLDADNLRRKAIANYYYTHIDNPLITLPGRLEWEVASSLDTSAPCRDEDCVYHIFPVLCLQRDALRDYLSQCGIGTMIHYPIPPHRQACYKEWNTLSLPVTEHIHQCELSIPCNPTMTDAEVETVCRSLNAFRKV